MTTQEEDWTEQEYRRYVRAQRERYRKAVEEAQRLRRRPQEKRPAKRPPARVVVGG